MKQLTLEDMFAQAAMEETAAPTVLIKFTFKNVDNSGSLKNTVDIEVEDSAKSIYDAWLDLAFMDDSPVTKSKNIALRYAYIVQKLQSIEIQTDDTFVIYDKVETKHDDKLDKHSPHNLQALVKWGNGFKKANANNYHRRGYTFQAIKSATQAIKKINKAIRGRKINLGELPMPIKEKGKALLDANYTLIEVGQTFMATDDMVFASAKDAKYYTLLTAPVVKIYVGSKPTSMGKIPVNDGHLSYEIENEDGKTEQGSNWNKFSSRRFVSRDTYFEAFVD